MVSNLITILEDRVSEQVEEQFGDKILKIPRSMIRKMCAVGGTAGGAGLGGVFMNYLAGLAGAPGALFVVVGGATFGVISGSFINDVCNDVAEEAALETTGRYSKEIIEYIKPSKFCKKFLTKSEEERNALMRLGSIIKRCGRFRPIDIIND